MNSRTLLVVALAFASRSAVAQDDSSKAGSPLSGWISFDLGFGAPSANCSDCSLSYGGGGFSGGFGTGLTIGKTSLGIEQNWTGVLVAASRNSSIFRMLTLGVESSPQLVWRAGVGTGRYKVDPTVLVDDRLAGMVGIEYRPRRRPDAGMRLEWLQSTRGDDVPQNEAPQRYAVRAIRFVAVWRVVIGG